MKPIILLIISTFLSTCSNAKKVDISILFEKELNVIKVGDNDVSDLDLTLIFQKDKEKITGFSGCNSYLGAYSIEGDSVAFSKIGVTKIYCPATSNNEKIFLNLLTTVTNYNITDNKTIELLDKNKKIIIIMKTLII